MPLSDKDKAKRAGTELLASINEAMEKADWPGILELVDMLPRAKNTFVTGAGRSGLVARSFGMRLMHAGLPAYIPGETITPAAGQGDLLVAISCTGETGYTDYLARRAQSLGAQVVVITTDGASPLAREADKVIIIPTTATDIVLRAAVFEHATSLCLDAVFNVLSDRLRVGQEEFRRRHANLE